ncbi:hypothetical protein B566_EDAN002978 [Ephemera danica]|nr:hypothetical protein B566_EDAN002978 [Ephemera danica]
MEFSSYSPCGSFLDYNSKLHSNSTSNTKYRKKYMKMKQTIKNLVFENAALCDQVSIIQEHVMIVKEERRFLLKKLYHFQAVSDMENQLTSAKMRGTGTSPPVTTAASHDATPTVKKVANKKAKTSSDAPGECTLHLALPSDSVR